MEQSVTQLRLSHDLFQMEYIVVMIRATTSLVGRIP